MTKLISDFAAQEQAAEERFLKKEEEHRREERAHEERMMQMMLQALQSPSMPLSMDQVTLPICLVLHFLYPMVKLKHSTTIMTAYSCNNVDNYEHIYIYTTYCAYHHVYSA